MVMMISTFAPPVSSTALRSRRRFDLRAVENDRDTSLQEMNGEYQQPTIGFGLDENAFETGERSFADARTLSLSEIGKRQYAFTRLRHSLDRLHFFVGDH